MAGKLKVTWERSAIGRAEDQKRTIRALGLRKLHQTVVKDDNPSIRGMVYKVRHLVRIEEA
ncbi:MAG TPA: 50S ribosomal protein L30 [Limnochordia bacterium]